MPAKQRASAVPMVCHRADLHTQSPAGYVEWHLWAERKAKTHEPRQCPGCGLWVVWEPKP